MSMEIIAPEFKPYGKTQRFKGFGVVLTEKIDGTNALVCVTEDGRVLAGSRNRWITPGKLTDNYGFAAFVEENKDELRKLGVGYHYGEWWGSGIGRGYDMGHDKVIVNGVLQNIPGAPARRVYSLFNTQRWGAHNPNTPACCSVVPVLYHGAFTGKEHLDAEKALLLTGSVAAPGYRRPEGICMYFLQTDTIFKVVFDKTGPSPIEAA